MWLKENKWKAEGKEGSGQRNRRNNIFLFHSIAKERTKKTKEQVLAIILISISCARFTKKIYHQIK